MAFGSIVVDVVMGHVVGVGIHAHPICLLQADSDVKLEHAFAEP
jgi:hypothetical protein